ncbi:MAG: hypothetical protein WCG66_12055 [bacterium]
MKKISLGLLIAGLLVLIGVILFKRTGGEAQAAVLAPQDTMLFVNIPNIPRTGFRWIGTALAQVAADPEMQAFLELPLKNFKESATTSDIGGLLAGLKPGNIFLAATKGSGEGVHILLGFQFWGGRKDFDAAVARLRKELPGGAQEPAQETHNGLDILATRHGDMTLYSAAAGRWGFLATGLEDLKTALDRSVGNSLEPSLKTNPKFLKVQAQLPTDPEIMFFLKPEMALDSLLALGRAAGAQPIPSQVEEIKSAEAVGGSLKFDGLLQRDAIFVLRSSSSDSLPKLTHPALALTQKDTTAFLDFALNFSALPRLAEGLAEIHPEISALAKPIAEAAGNAYGPECALLANWPDGNMAPNPLVALTVKDEARSSAFLSETLGTLPGASRREQSKRILYSIPTGYVSIDIVQMDGFLLLGLDPQTVLNAATASSAGTLRDSTDFKLAEPSLQSANEAFCYIDTRTVFTRVYDSLLPLIRFGAAMMPDLKKQMDVSKLPKAEIIARHLPPIVLSQKRTTEGTLVQSSGPISMAEFLLLAGLGTAYANHGLIGR